PIHLMGYSIGGLAAYELARELERRSIPVASLILVDSLDSRWTWLGAWTVEAMNRFPRLFENLSKWTGDKRFIEVAGDHRLLNLLRMAMSYRIDPWDGHLTFVGRSQGNWLVRMGARLWGRGARSVDWMCVPGGHSSLFLEPQVRVLAMRLETVLSAAEADEADRHAMGGTYE
ncbi:MAG: hypothetical protein K9H11_20555, partial [Rhodospirillum sp.]|nr:hypothetical protein [Rhodospirillum sp.]